MFKTKQMVMANVLTRKEIIMLLILWRRIKKRRMKNKKRFWVREILKERNTKGEYHLLIKELKLYDHEFFYKQFRITPTKYEELLCWVAPKIIKSNIKRESISPGERLCVTLRFLVTGDAQTTIGASY